MAGRYCVAGCGEYAAQEGKTRKLCPRELVVNTESLELDVLSLTMWPSSAHWR